jgi:hypothetical protein
LFVHRQPPGVAAFVRESACRKLAPRHSPADAAVG